MLLRIHSSIKQKKKREEAERLRKLEEERLKKAMAADAAKKEAQRLHQVCCSSNLLGQTSVHIDCRSVISFPAINREERWGAGRWLNHVRSKIMNV